MSKVTDFLVQEGMSRVGKKAAKIAKVAALVAELEQALRAALAHPTPGGAHYPWMTQADHVLKKMETL